MASELLRSRGVRRERTLQSPRFNNGRFHNSDPTESTIAKAKRSGWSTTSEYFFSDAIKRPPAPLPIETPLETWLRPAETGLRATWLGHSTTLLEIDGYRILTDPVWSERISPVPFVGPRRFHVAPVRLEELPLLDAILISHDHFDHLDFSTVRSLARLQPNATFYTSLGVGDRLEGLGISPHRIVELDWWEEAKIGASDLAITATPSRHFSGRSLLDRNVTLWSSWVLETPKHRVFFSGDTGLTKDFTTIGERKGPFDLVMLEVGAFHPSWGDIHLGPERPIIAEGGTAIIYAATDLRLGHEVALKVLHSHQNTPLNAERLAREARVAAQLRHPNVCLVTDLGMTEELGSYLVMERLVGRTLMQRLAPAERVSFSEAVDVIGQVLSVLDTAHSIGVVHRDVKPDNIFLSDVRGRMPLVKVLDFGIAKHVSEPGLTSTGAVVGTPLYMAPEQVRGEINVDRRCDVYACGVILYEMLAGARPFQSSATDPHALHDAIITGTKRPLLELRPDTPPLLVEAIDRALRPDRERRFGSALELLSALECAVGTNVNVVVDKPRDDWDYSTAEIRDSDPDPHPDPDRDPYIEFGDTTERDEPPTNQPSTRDPPTTRRLR